MGLWGLGAMFFYLGGLDFGNREANCKLAPTQKDGKPRRARRGRSEEVEEEPVRSRTTAGAKRGEGQARACP